MKTIPVDTSKITALIGGAVEAATSDDGVQRHNAEGKPLFNVPVIVVVEGGKPATFNVRVAGAVPQLAPLTPVKLTGLVAKPWAMGDRSGISFSADSVQPTNGARQ